MFFPLLQFILLFCFLVTAAMMLMVLFYPRAELVYAAFLGATGFLTFKLGCKAYSFFKRKGVFA